MKRWFLVCIGSVAICLAQHDSSYLHSLPMANYFQNDSMINRWGEMKNVVTVNFRKNLDGEYLWETTLIQAEVSSHSATHILFPAGGSETDIFIYPIQSFTNDDFEVDFNQLLKKNIFMISTPIEERLIQIDDLPVGYYYVSYVSCHYGTSFILEIKIHQPINAAP